MEIYLIGDVVRETGLSLDTVNYYLRIGLIKEIGRSPRNNYRYFDNSTITALRKIMDLRLEKVPIKEIQRRLRDGLL